MMKYHRNRNTTNISKNKITLLLDDNKKDGVQKDTKVIVNF